MVILRRRVPLPPPPLPLEPDPPEADLGEDEAARSNPKYKQLTDEIAFQREKYAAVARANIPLRQRAEELIRGAHLDDPKYWNMEAIRALATRIDQLREDRKQNSVKFSEVEDIVARYNVWIGALTGGISDNALADDIAHDF